MRRGFAILSWAEGAGSKSMKTESKVGKSISFGSDLGSVILFTSSCVLVEETSKLLRKPLLSGTMISVYTSRTFQGTSRLLGRRPVIFLDLAAGGPGVKSKSSETARISRAYRHAVKMTTMASRRFLDLVNPTICYRGLTSMQSYIVYAAFFAGSHTGISSSAASLHQLRV